MSSVVVVGAGLSGLSAACYLTGQGYEVTVVEREHGRPCKDATRRQRWSGTLVFREGRPSM
jgi:predicted NAD/FAD-dependent oxidoreductase